MSSIERRPEGQTRRSLMDAPVTYRKQASPAADPGDESTAEEPGRRRPLRIAGIIIALLLVGGAAAYVWHAYVEAHSADAADSQVADPGKEIEDLKATIAQLQAADQKIAAAVVALQTSDQTTQQALASQQAEMQRLSNGLAALTNRIDGLQRGAAPPRPPRPAVAQKKPPAAAPIAPSPPSPIPGATPQ